MDDDESWGIAPFQETLNDVFGLWPNGGNIQWLSVSRKNEHIRSDKGRGEVDDVISCYSQPSF